MDAIIIFAEFPNKLIVRISLRSNLIEVLPDLCIRFLLCRIASCRCIMLFFYNKFGNMRGFM